MDIISYSKAMKAKKNLDSLNKRLGVGDYKSGDKDIKGTYANVKTRLDELEKKRQGLLPRTKAVPVQEGTVAEGVWTSNTIHLEEDALELKSIKVKGTLTTSGENLAKGGVATASSYRNSGGDQSNPPAKAFDGLKNGGLGWQSGPGAALPHWIMYDFGSATKVVNKYKIRARSNAQYISQSPKNWILKGLPLGENEEWVELDTQVGQVDWGEYEEREFSFDNSVAYRIYRLIILETNGYYEENGYPVNIDELEFYAGNSVPLDLPKDKVKVSVQTTAGFVDVGSNFEILSKFSKDIQVQVTVLDKAYKISSIEVSYMNRPLSDRVSEVEANVHTNLNKHNLRVSALLDKKRYKLKDMIMDDFGDDTGINLEHSVNLKHDKDGHKVKQTDAGTFAVLTTVTEKATSVPEMILVSALTGEKAGAEFYVSRDSGVTWTPVKLDTLTKVNMQPEGKDVVIKVILRDGQELHAMSYSWI
ncbi:discoidin domain-containing protein [Bacillus mobilis]|uniref:discoidin domain-containing protein n=1 Tax=Bacillus mobilis TaxID=2026190 RepID=UPI0036795294